MPTAKFSGVQPVEKVCNPDSVELVMTGQLRKREGIFTFAFFLGCFAFLYPELFLLQATPMGGDSWTIKDPAVSWAAFMPSWREFRYEFLNHGNLLWSDLRAMGQPMLGNGVQAAPLFPLNLALIALPDLWYWTAMPILRVVLIALALYLTARKVFKLSILASLIFALMCGFNLNVMRWINHPWCNGILAGVWYFYFICSVILPSKSTLYSNRSGVLGLIISVYAMVTAGFPEASAVSAIFAVFLFVGVLFAYWKKLRPNIWASLRIVLLCHIAGFCLSAPQIFALLEYIDFTLAMDLREGFIGGGYTADDTIAFALAQFSLFWRTTAQHQYLNFYLGFIGFFFLFRGMLGSLLFKSSNSLVSAERRKIQCCFAIAFTAMMLLYVVKSFNLSSSLEWVFSVTPVLAQSHFPLYFSPLLYFGLAYFVALGVDGLIESLSLDKQRRIGELCIAVIGFSLAIYLSYRTVNLYSAVEQDQFWGLFYSAKGFAHGRYFAMLAGVIFILLGFSLIPSAHAVLVKRKRVLGAALAAGLMLCLLSEFSHTYPKGFSKRGHVFLEVSPDISSSIKRAIDAAPLPRHELRGYNKFGMFAGEGLATIDNGVSAMLGPELRGLRLGLFNTEYGSYLSLDSAKTAWSYEALSNNIQAIHITPKVSNDWTPYELDPSFNNKIEGPEERLVKMVNPFYLEGISTVFNENPVQPQFWYKFEGDEETFWVEGNISSFDAKQDQSGRYKITGRWRLRIPTEWLPEAQYKLSLRHFNPDAVSYFDTPAILLHLDKPKTAEQELQRLAFSTDNTRHIYFNPKALPRAFVASACQLMATEKQVQEFLKSSPTVIEGNVGLNLDEAWPEQFCDTYRNKFRRIPIQQKNSSNLDFGVIKGPALLIVNDSFYPGWQAHDLISGSKIKIKHANLAVRAVYLSESRDYHINMTYRPWWLTWVYFLLALGLIITVYLLLMLPKRPFNRVSS
ncbi:MAG: hypothetical protein ACI9WC_002828 [Arenicella sp.]|jgi:hypothetical protein